MNTIIALRGRGNSGKSTTIRFLYCLLLQNGYQLNKNKFYSGEFISAVFSKNEKLIGIMSYGDTYDLVHDHLKELVEDNCNICICACRTFDRIPLGTNAAVIEFTNYSHQFVEKTIDINDATQKTTNLNDAEILFSIIDSMI